MQHTYSERSWQNRINADCTVRFGVVARRYHQILRRITIPFTFIAGPIDMFHKFIQIIHEISRACHAQNFEIGGSRKQITGLAESILSIKASKKIVKIF